MKILLDAGHGAGKAHNRGGICYNEGDNNYYYSLVLREELLKYENVKVDLTRNKISDNPSLAARSAKGAGYDLFLSLHSNAADKSVRGSEIWDSLERPNKALADALVQAISSSFGHRNRGTKYREGQPGYNWYGVLRFNQAESSMIIEHGFHTNSTDCNFFKNNHTRIASTTAKVIANHYGLRLKGSSGGSSSVKGGDILYRVQIGAFRDKQNASNLVKELKSKGYDAFVRSEGNVVIEKADISKGSKVQVKQGSKTYDGKGLANFVYNNVYDIIQISGNRVVIGKGKTVTAAVNKKDLIIK